MLNAPESDYSAVFVQDLHRAIWPKMHSCSHLCASVIKQYNLVPAKAGA